MKTGMDVEGLDDVKKKIEKLGGNVTGAMANALWQNGQEVHRFSVRKTPIATGHLRRSYVVDAPNVRGDEVTVLVGFSARYALFVHEIQKAYRKGDWKFLERALDEAASGWQERLLKRTLRNLESGKTRLPSEDGGPEFDRGQFGE